MLGNFSPRWAIKKVFPICIASVVFKDSSATTFYILNNVKIPNGVSLKLDADEFNFNRTVYTLYINTDNAAGGIDVIINR